MKRPTGAAATINSAQASGSGRGAPAGPAGPGSAKKADMASAFSSNVNAGVVAQLSTLGSATQALQAEHPIPHYDHGPHHGTTTHQRHAPVDMSMVKSRG